MLNFLIFIKKGFKQFYIVIHINNTSSFSNTMHSQLRCSNINSFNPSFPCRNRSNSRSTWWVIFYYKILQRYIMFISNYPQKTLRDCIWCVSLISVYFKNYSLVEFALMVGLVFIGVAWMDWMRTICWEDITLS